MPPEQWRPVAPGLELAAYRIEAAVGEGGMGAACRATDTKLHRPVAIKFLRSRMRTFDVAADGKRIIFDRTKDNSSIVLIDLPGGAR